MSLSYISRLKALVEKSGSKKKIEACEDAIIESMEEFVKEESFYELPTNEILKIIGKSEIGDVELLCEVISRMSENKGGESTLLLNVIKREEATLEECIKILSNFKHSPLCQQTSELFKNDKDLLERDYEYEMKELEEKNKELQKEIKEKKTYFLPVTEKPSDFESDIIVAADKGKLTSIQYLVEQCHEDVEIEDKDGYTPINIASSNGCLEVVKYLYETCHADVETEAKNGHTPINIASACGHLEVVKYLYEVCHEKITDIDITRI